MKKNIKKLLLLSFLSSLVLLVKAGTGRVDAPLQGYVTDAVTKKPVCGVTVSASLAGAASREVMTDADGYFSFVQLPSAQFTLQFDKKGYLSYKKAGVIIREKTPVKVNIEVSPEAVPAADSGDSEYPLLRMMRLN